MKFIILSILTIICIYIIIVYLTYNPAIPIVTIGYNNLYFINNFIEQIKKYKNPIIIFDNKSTYSPMFEYYKNIKKELGSKIEIHLLDKNYGGGVYRVFKHMLPDIFILSDPDLQLNPNMPANFAEILYNLSVKYKAFKIALALDISEKDRLVPCKNYADNKSIYEWERQYWKIRIDDPEYELYKAGHPLDTTFCLLNYKYSIDNRIRIAGNFTAKHLPWYNNYLRDHLSEDEINHWKKNNNSSSIILNGCMAN